MEYSISGRDREILRETAKRQLELANEDSNKERIQKWYLHNDLKGDRPMIHLEMGTFAQEILPERMKCTGEFARWAEGVMYGNFLNQELFDDDRVTPDYFPAPYDTWFSLFDIPVKVDHTTDASGRESLGHHFVPVLRDLEEDYEKLKPSSFGADLESSRARKEAIEECIGDILPVKMQLGSMYSVPTQMLVHIMKMEDMMLAMYDAQLSLKNLEDSKDQLMAEFRTMTGIEGAFTTEELPEPVLLSLPSAEEIFAEFGENSIDVQSARNALQSARNAETTAKLSAYVPTLTASVGYSYSGAHSESWDYSTTGNGLTGSVRMSLPISGMIPTSQTDITIKERKDDVTLASLSLQGAKDTLLADIRSYVMGIDQAEKSLAIAERSRAAAARTDELAQEAFQAGLMSADDASDARTKLLNAEMSLLSARLTHLLESYNLAAAINIPLSDLQARYARI